MTFDDFSPIAMTCFKAYDIRGKLGIDLDEDIAYRIGAAFAQYLNPTGDATRHIVIGADIRPSSAALKTAVISGILATGTSVLDLGMTGTEEVYFATSFYGAIGGIEVTASHNPIDYNGMKLVGEGSRPIGIDSGSQAIKMLAERGDFITNNQGNYELVPDKTAYIDHLLSYINLDKLTFDTPLKIVVNCGNGSAAPVIDLLEARLAKHTICFIKIHHSPDGSFPNGIPNPMIVQNRTATAQAILRHNADLGIAFDGDFDRCFFFDEQGRFIEGAYMVGVLAQAFLQKYPNSGIVYDPRNVLNTEQIIEDNNGQALISQSGHSYMKQMMRQHGAVYGGEMSAHHYFKDFYYCDSGMIPWLLVVELLATCQQSLSTLVHTMMSNFPISGEINFSLTDITPSQMITLIQENIACFDDKKPTLDYLDGLSVHFGDWRFNVRASNTEPLIRLNAESCGDATLLAQKVDSLCAFIVAHGGELA